MVGNLISMFLGFASAARDKADELTGILMEKGEIQREEVRRFAESLIEKGETERDAYLNKMIENIKSLRHKIVTKEDIENLEKKIEELNDKIHAG